MLFLWYPRCSTCQEAKKWLDENAIDYELRDITLDNPTKEEIKDWSKRTVLPLKRFFNTSGIMYKELGLSKKIDSLGEDELIDLLSSNGKLVKRPLIVMDSKVLIGFKEEEWKTELL